MAPSSIEPVKLEVSKALQPVVVEQIKTAESSVPAKVADNAEIPEKSEEEAAYAEIAEAVRQQFSQTRVSFSGSSKEIQFTVVDEETGEVVRSFPEKGTGGVLARKA